MAYRRILKVIFSENTSEDFTVLIAIYGSSQGLITNYVMMKNLLIVVSFIAAYITACTSGSGDRILFGTFPNGADASLIRDQNGKWGIIISGEQTATFKQSEPVEVELYLSDNDIQHLSAGYDKIKKKGGLFIGEVTLKTTGGAVFLVSDQWSVDDGVVIMKRNLTVKGNHQDAGFYSAFRLMTKPKQLERVNFLALAFIRRSFL